MKKIGEGKFEEAIKEIESLNDHSLSFEPFCDLLEEVARQKHPSTVRFFQLAHTAAEQFFPYKFDGANVDTHPYCILLNAYRAAEREQDLIDLIMGEKDLVRDLLLMEAVRRWAGGEKKDFSLVLSLAERIDTPLHRASAFATIALFQSLDGVDESAALANADSAFAQIDESQESYSGHMDMVRAEIARVKK